MIKVGDTEITSIKLGSTYISNVYIGSSLLFDRSKSIIISQRHILIVIMKNNI